ncbi:HNH endonuclease [Acidocella sp.]|uniref:HNH endonuclease n=1 Tax=Acidocella sp. TaxID=50710 RepID=UPI0026148C99|nr:HNH endonuclease [Acidocella sp.]
MQQPPDLDRAMESGTANALKIYSDNYDIKFYGKLSNSRPKEFLGSARRICRYCDQSEPTVTFEKEAHAIPMALGNRRLFSLDECTSCNEHFSLIDDDLAKMVMGELVMGQVRGYGGLRKLTSPGQRSRIDSVKGEQIIKFFVGENFVAHDEDRRQMTIRYQTQPYHPLGAYKCLAKIAYSLLPEHQLIHFSQLKKWLTSEDTTTNKIYADDFHLCHYTFVPGFRPYQQLSAILLTRKTDISMPYCSLVIAFGNISLQIFPPCPAKDAGLVGKAVDFTKFPLTYDLQPWLVNDDIKTFAVDLSSSQLIREEREILMKYGGITPK